MYATNRAQAGRTLLELTGALGILAVLVALAAPSLTRLEARTTLRTETTRLWESVLRARELAVVHGTPVVLCPVDATGAVCATEPHWHDGWIAFADRDGDGVRDTGEQSLDRAEPAAPAVRITTSQARRRFRFDPRGMAWGSNATVHVCHREEAVEGRILVLSGTGRIRVDRTREPTC